MMKRFAVPLALGSLVAAGFAQADTGTVYPIGTSTSVSSVIAGNGGEYGGAYVLGVLGTAPPGAAPNPNYAYGTVLDVITTIPGQSSFQDFITFAIGGSTASTTTGWTTAFNIVAVNGRNNNPNILSQFGSFNVSLFSGLVFDFGVASAAKGTATNLLGIGGIGFNAAALAVKNSFVDESFVKQLNPGIYTMYINGVALGSNPLYSVELNAVPVPEPGTYAMLLAGLAAVAFVAKRRAG